MQTVSRFLGYFRPVVGKMVVASLLLALAGGLMSILVASMKPLVNEVLNSDVVDSGPDILDELEKWIPTGSVRSWIEERSFMEVPLLIVVVFALRGLFVYFGQYTTTKVGALVIRNLRTELFENIARQSPGFFSQHSTGEVLSRVMNDVQRLQFVSTVILADLVRVSTMIPFMLIVVLVHDWRMSLFALVVLPMMAYPMIRLGKRLRRTSKWSQESMAEASNLLAETVSGIKIVQAFGMEKFEISRFRTALTQMLRVDLKVGRAAAATSPIMEQIGAIAGASLLTIAGYGITKGFIDPGNFSVVIGGLGVLYMSVRKLNFINVQIQQALAAADRVFEVLDTEPDIREVEGAKSLRGFEREIRFEKVNFAYDQDPVLVDLDLTIEHGSMVALVGRSGSGKTTVAQLVPRFYDPSSGRITIDGEDINGVTLASLRGLIGLVTQETVLFSDSVRNNISYGREDLSFEQIVRAAKAANAHEFIDRLPRGYDTQLGERGEGLSMGQRQRIAIARALIKDPPILILDEATSALDAESESLVQGALDVLLQGRTSLVVAHRLSTVRQADRIVVVEEGKIIEQGTHDELVQRRGLYARLHELQIRDGNTPRSPASSLESASR
ncbi:MAG: ABC transporter ATP-binding protein [Acidobacteriota bacterium]